MQGSDESTPNLKASIEKINWEESLPLPEESPVLPLPVVKEAAKTQTVSAELEVPVVKEKRSFIAKIWNWKIILTASSLIIVGITVGLIFSFVSREEVTETLKSVSPPPTSQAVLPRRVSSAFVPRVPSQEPADLSINWVKFVNNQTGLTFPHPEEWQVAKGNGDTQYTLYYPVVDENELNFGKTVLAKISITKTQNPNNEELVEFLSKRYNLFNINLEQQNLGEFTGYSFKLENIFVLAIPKTDKLYILEGKTARLEDFENFLPIFLGISQNLQFSQ